MQYTDRFKAVNMPGRFDGHNVSVIAESLSVCKGYGGYLRSDYFNKARFILFWHLKCDRTVVFPLWILKVLESCQILLNKAKFGLYELNKNSVLILHTFSSRGFPVRGCRFFFCNMKSNRALLSLFFWI